MNIVNDVPGDTAESQLPQPRASVRGQADHRAWHGRHVLCDRTRGIGPVENVPVGLQAILFLYLPRDPLDVTRFRRVRGQGRCLQIRFLNLHEEEICTGVLGQLCGERNDRLGQGGPVEAHQQRLDGALPVSAQAWPGQHHGSTGVFEHIRCNASQQHVAHGPAGVCGHADRGIGRLCQDGPERALLGAHWDRVQVSLENGDARRLDSVILRFPGQFTAAVFIG